MRSRSIFLGVMLSVAVAGCSADGPATAPAQKGPASGTTQSPPDASTGSEGAAGGSAGVVDVCAIVTPADLAPVLPGVVTASTQPTNASGCVYVSSTDAGVTIEVVTGDASAMFWDGSVPPQSSDYTVPLTGIGDKAMMGTTLGPDLVSIKGSTFCAVEVESGHPEIYVGLATPDANDNVPIESATAIAEKLGQLCNKIFASQ